MSDTESGQLVETGSKAPAFALKDQQGQLHRLSEYAGQWVVLYFYPKDNTSGCTKQACGFRDQLPDFTGADAVVLGVSPDDEKSHGKFATKFDLPFTLLADPDHDALNKYGVWQEKSMYGRKYMGVVRTTYLINPKGKVVQRWDKVKVAKHVQEVLDALTVHQQSDSV
jgi:peroxiredoxin Q/BCP